MSSLEDRLAKLERLVEAQQAIIEAKDAEIARLQARLDVLERRLGENSSNSNKPHCMAAGYERGAIGPPAAARPDNPKAAFVACTCTADGKAPLELRADTLTDP